MRNYKLKLTNGVIVDPEEYFAFTYGGRGEHRFIGGIQDYEAAVETFCSLHEAGRGGVHITTRYGSEDTSIEYIPLSMIQSIVKKED